MSRVKASAAAVLLLWGGACNAFGQDVDVRDLLRLTIMHHKAHRERLKTLEAEFEITSVSHVAQPGWPIARPKEEAEELAARFAEEPHFQRSNTKAGVLLDVPNNALRSSFVQTAVEYVNADESVLTPARVTRYRKESILTGQHFLWFDEHTRDPVEKDLQVVPARSHRRVVREDRNRGQSLTFASDVFDPRSLFDCYGRSIDDQLARFLKNHDDGVSPISARPIENGWHLLWSKGNQAFEAEIRNFDADLMLTRCDFDTGRGKFTRRWDYSRHSGVLLPTSFQRTHVGQDGALVNSREVRMVACKPLNDAVDAGAFELESLLREGDQLEDKIDGRMRIQTKDGLVDEKPLVENGE